MQSISALQSIPAFACLFRLVRLCAHYTPTPAASLSPPRESALTRSYSTSRRFGNDWRSSSSAPESRSFLRDT